MMMMIREEKQSAAEVLEHKMGEEFRSLGEDSGGKYLGELKNDQIKQEMMKGKK